MFSIIGREGKRTTSSSTTTSTTATATSPAVATTAATAVAAHLVQTGVDLLLRLCKNLNEITGLLGVYKFC